MGTQQAHTGDPRPDRGRCRRGSVR